VVVVRLFRPQDVAGFEAAMVPGGNDGTWLILRGSAKESLAAHIGGWAAGGPGGPALAVARAADAALAGVVYLAVRGEGSVELAYGVAGARHCRAGGAADGGMAEPEVH
jgi:hypothetical protein